MKLKFHFLPVALVLCMGLAGCESNFYSSAIKYAVRTDPLVIDEKNLGDEQVAPDRPGIFPLFSRKDLDDPFNPMYKNRKTLFNEQKLLDPTLIKKKDRQDLESRLVWFFGTPARPLVRLDGGRDKIDALKLDEETLQRGAYTYRLQCLHCHGVTGDGRGPTSRWVNPHPRDYRLGLFKFMSVNQVDGPVPPRREDLFRIVHQGVEGTAMPSFALLARTELEDVVSYVIHLSIRGKVEFDTISKTFSYDAKAETFSLDTESPLEDRMEGFLNKVVQDWYDSQDSKKAIEPGPYPYDDNDLKQLKESIQRGFQLFKGEGEDKPGPTSVSKDEAGKAKCVSCHKDFGRQALYKFDSWGTLTKPRDMTSGVFRGGRRPVDIYYRIHSGISGAGMTSFGNVLKNTDRIWDLVNFVKTMPYPAMRKSMGIVLD